MMKNLYTYKIFEKYQDIKYEQLIFELEIPYTDVKELLLYIKNIFGIELLKYINEFLYLRDYLSSIYQFYVYDEVLSIPKNKRKTFTQWFVLDELEYIGDFFWRC